jgi:hypothetical protein
MGHLAHLIFTSILGDFDVGSVDSAEKKSSVKGELHVGLSCQLLVFDSSRNSELTVPEASVPAVLICTEISQAGIKTSAIETL